MRPTSRRTDEQGASPTETAEGLFDRLRSGELADLRLGLMHGRLPADEKDAAMAAFRAGEIDVLVCTTVIEVGVDVPNATVMLVMDADRFGISQLHQLRGRIGRGEHPSLCLLASWSLAGIAGRPAAAVPSPRRWTVSPWPTWTSRSAGKEMCWAATSPARRSPCGCCRWPTTWCSSKPPGNSAPGPIEDADPHPGLALLAAQFTDTDRIEYLDKS